MMRSADADHEVVQGRWDSHLLSRLGSDRINCVPAAWTRRLRLFFDPFTNQQLRAAVQSEHLEADHADGDTIAAEKIVHARQSGMDARTDEQHGNLTLRSVVLAVQ